jgi:hypothetical protein
MDLLADLEQIIEQQLSDETALRRVVALFQRKLGSIFGNASVRRCQRRYEIDLAVYETPIQGGQAHRMSDRQIREWVRQAALRAHPRLYTRLEVNIGKWTGGRVSQKQFVPVQILVDARPTA